MADPRWARRRSGSTEFGGDAGLIQRSGKGKSVIDPSVTVESDEHELNAQEKAMVMRSHGIRTPSGEVRLDGTPWPEGVARRDEALEKMSGRTAEEAAE